MRLSYWLRRLCAHWKLPRGRALIRQRPWLSLSRSRIELLESRIYLSPVAWDGGGDGVHWGDPLNWSADVLPVSVDDVTIGFGTATIIHNINDDTIHSLTTSNKVVLSGGTLTINSLSSINNDFTISGGVLGGTGDVTYSGILNWTSGTQSGSGRTIIAASGGLNVSGS